MITNLFESNKHLLLHWLSLCSNIYDVCIPNCLCHSLTTKKHKNNNNIFFVSPFDSDDTNSTWMKNFASFMTEKWNDNNRAQDIKASNKNEIEKAPKSYAFQFILIWFSCTDIQAVSSRKEERYFSKYLIFHSVVSNRDSRLSLCLVETIRKRKRKQQQQQQQPDASKEAGEKAVNSNWHDVNELDKNESIWRLLHLQSAAKMPRFVPFFSMAFLFRRRKFLQSQDL